MTNFYLTENTSILTTSGMKLLKDLSEDDKIVVLDKNNNFVESSRYNLNIKKDKDINFYEDSLYSQLKYSGDLNILSNSNILIESENIPCTTFNIDDVWYKAPKDLVITLSIIISSYFKETGDGLVEIDNKSKKVLFQYFSIINKKYGIYFPYNFTTKSYEFTTNLFKSTEELTKILLDNKYLFNNIITTINKLQSKNYKYVAFFIKEYQFATLFQSLLSLSNYNSKLVYDSIKDKFRITFVKSELADFAHRNNIRPLLYSKEKTLINITLEDTSGYIIVSQNNYKNTTSSLVKVDSIYYTAN